MGEEGNVNDNLKAAINKARSAGMTGLVCGVCAGFSARHPYGCPACDGTGYPSAAEVLMSTHRE